MRVEVRARIATGTGSAAAAVVPGSVAAGSAAAWRCRAAAVRKLSSLPALPVAMNRVPGLTGVRP